MKIICTLSDKVFPESLASCESQQAFRKCMISSFLRTVRARRRARRFCKDAVRIQLWSPIDYKSQEILQGGFYPSNFMTVIPTQKPLVTASEESTFS